VKLPFIISIPHCSDRVPGAIQPALALGHEAVNDSVDWGTGEIFGPLDAAETLRANWSRLVVDLNRDPRRRDAKGVIPGVDYYGRPVYRPGMAPTGTAIDKLIHLYYRPYHLQLQVALRNGNVRGLFDAHSLNGIGPSEAPDAGEKRKDIVLSTNGDKMGEPAAPLGQPTCRAETLHRLKEIFEGAGFSVSMNDPYTAGFITTHYGHELAEAGKFAVQIEINQDLFILPEELAMDPDRLAATSDRIQGCFDAIARIL